MSFGSSTNPIAAAAADPDGDRVRNDAEHLLGRDPLDSDDRWGIDALVFSNGIPGLVFEQLAGLSFEVQCTTNVSDTNRWFTLDIPANTPFYSSLTATTTRFDVTATNGVPRKFYRIRISGP